MTRPPFPSSPLCGEYANCRVEPGVEVDHSADTPSYLHPRFLAEEVCPDALVRSIRERRSQSQLQAAWGGLELALSLQERPEDAAAFLNYAEETFTKMQSSEKEFLQISANIGMIFMPAYWARYDGEPLSSRELAGIHYSLAGTLETFDALYDPLGRDKFSGVKPELVTLALFARLRSSEWLAYPASPREENTDITSFNHDSYVIRNWLKVPIQVKRKGGSGYDDSVVMVSFARILARVNQERSRRTTQLWGNKRKATRPLAPLGAADFAGLIVREAKGQWLTEHESWLLELASMTAVREVLAKEAIIRGQLAQKVAQGAGKAALAA